MSNVDRLALSIYRFLLAWYPSEFRAEFGAEMQLVFQMGLKEDQHSEGTIIGRLLWREIRYWPRTVLREHLHARRNKMTPNMIDEKPISGRELLAALTIFLLPLFSILATSGNSLRPWINYIILILFWGAVICALGLALIQKLPRWSLPYLGFLLMLGLILGQYYRVWIWIYPLFLDAFGAQLTWSPIIQVVYACIFEALTWVTIFVSALILVNLLRLIPYTRGVWQRIRADWTQLSFLLYGTLVFYIVLTFEEYRYDEVWKFAAWLCLAVGAWLYLRAKQQKQRILALAGGATAALWITILAKWILVPLQEWPTGYPIAPSEASRWVETSYTFISWVSFMIVILAPAWLSRLPRKPIIAQKEEEPITV